MRYTSGMPLLGRDQRGNRVSWRQQVFGQLRVSPEEAAVLHLMCALGFNINQFMVSLYTSWRMVYDLSFMIHDLWFMVHGLWIMICSL